MVIDDESQRILRCMGVLERLFPDDIAPFNTHRFVDNQRRLLAGLDTKVAETHDISMGAIFHQPALEELLRSDFTQGSGVDAFLGNDVTAVDGDDHGVRLTARNLATGAECRYRARYLVGCDGGSSTVRRAMDVQRVDFNYAKTWMVMDTVVEDAAFFATIPEGSEFLCDSGRAAVFVKGRRNFVRFDFEVTEREQATYSNAHAVEHISRYYDPKFFEVVRLAPYRFYAGMSEHWRKGRLFLAGDAAHQTPPFAGQGLNMGLRDAENLAFKLNLVLSGRSSDAILDTYQEELQGNCATLIKGAVHSGKLISSGNPVVVQLRFLALFVFSRSATLIRLAYRLMVRKQPYKRGLLGNSHKLSGTLMAELYVADAAGVRTSLDEVLGRGFVLLTTARDADQARLFETKVGGTVCVVGEDVLDPDRKLLGWLRKHRVTHVVIRPDRYIFDAGIDADALSHSLLEQLA